MASVRLAAVNKQFGSTHVIKNASLDIADGEFVVFVGPSGCGKSTLLRLIAGLEDVSDGTIEIGERDVTHEAAVDRGIAMVFQSYALYPHMSVEQNMGFGLKMNGVDRDTVRQKVEAAAQTLQLQDLLKRKPKQLSGGQRQRVAIGRAIVREPGVFLFDEPLSNLDAELRVEMRLQIARLHQNLGATMVYVTHDQTEAMTMADRIVVLRDGRVEQTGTPLELYHRPGNQFVAGFIGSPKMNFLSGVLRESGAHGSQLELVDGSQISVPINTAAASVGDAVTIGVRPEDCSGGDGGINLTLQVELAEHLGNSTYLYGQCGGSGNFVVQRPGSDATPAGQQISLRVDTERVYVFGSDEQAFPRLADAAAN